MQEQPLPDQPPSAPAEGATSPAQAAPGKPADAVTYVGGLGELPRPPVWPYLALGLIPVILAVVAVALWNPIRSLGRSAGATIAPYSLTLTRVSWSDNQKIVGVPVTLSLNVDNTDRRAIRGLSLEFTRLDRAWEIMEANSPQSTAQINSSSIFFPDVVKPGGSTTLTVRFRPDKAMETEIDFQLTPGGSSTPGRFQLSDGSTTSTLGLPVKVREPVESDADARLTAIYNTHTQKGEQTVWRIHVANTGPIVIDGIRLKFANLPPGDIRLEPDATLLSDGQTLQFDRTLAPGGQTILLMILTPMAAGHYQVAIQVYLGKSTEPLSSANGGPPLSIDLTVG